MKNFLPALKSFLVSEAFDVCLFWLAITLVILGVFWIFGLGEALVTAGVILLLSVKPIVRWIR